ncbi:MAG TPA: amidophosphoribosyltransferase [Gammaproteobacteria bacterium]|nr:amidophosphoribosyltransferase [Gammaproteobacteria bacterium]
MCGVVGAVLKSDVNLLLYESLTVLQHRGQDAAGITTLDNGYFNLSKSNGLVHDVFQADHMLRLTGRVGIGHCRYPTAGSSSSSQAQPFYVNAPFGISLAHNGNLTNAMALKQEMFRTDMRHVNTDSDSEVLLNVFAHELHRLGKADLDQEDIFNAVSAVHRRCRGAYAVVLMINGHGMVGFRDPNGIRPLVYGKRETEQGDEYMLASESVALDFQGFELIADVAPGEAVYCDLDGNLWTKQCADKAQRSPCIFEYVYFARPDSMIDGISVYKSRLRMGEKLGQQIKKQWHDKHIDVVIPIPDTARTAAMELARELNVVYREGFIKNRYIGRTFIMPGQKERQRSVRRKLNAIDLEFDGKNVLLVDDSIVRGTTSQQIVQMARDAGANQVYFASAAPPVCFPNVYGIDMPSASELIGHQRELEQIRQAIGADALIYQTLEDLENAVCGHYGHITRFDSSCFNGDYVTGDVDEAYLKRLKDSRNDAAQERRRSQDKGYTVLAVHNNS